MGRPRRIEPCADCGTPTPRRGRMTDGIRCAPCSIARSAEAIRQLRAKRGEFYDRWFAGMARYVHETYEAEQDPDLSPAEREPRY